MPVEIVAHLFRLPMYTMLAANIHEGKVDAGQQWRNVTLIALACHSLYHFSQCKVTQVWVRVPCPWTEVGHYMQLTQLYIQWFNDHCLPGTQGHPPVQWSLPTYQAHMDIHWLNDHYLPGTQDTGSMTITLPTRHTDTGSMIITYQTHRHWFNDHYLSDTQTLVQWSLPTRHTDTSSIIITYQTHRHWFNDHYLPGTQAYRSDDHYLPGTQDTGSMIITYQAHRHWFNDHYLPGTQAYRSDDHYLPGTQDTGSMIITYQAHRHWFNYHYLPLSTRHTCTSTGSIIITYQAHRDIHLFNYHYPPGTQGHPPVQWPLPTRHTGNKNVLFSSVHSELWQALQLPPVQSWPSWWRCWFQILLYITPSPQKTN